MDLAAPCKFVEADMDAFFALAKRRHEPVLRGVGAGSIARVARRAASKKILGSRTRSCALTGRLWCCDMDIAVE